MPRHQRSKRKDNSITYDNTDCGTGISPSTTGILVSITSWVTRAVAVVVVGTRRRVLTVLQPLEMGRNIHGDCFPAATETSWMTLDHAGNKKEAVADWIKCSRSAPVSRRVSNMNDEVDEEDCGDARKNNTQINPATR